MAKDKDPKDQKRQDAKPKGDGAPQQPKAPQQAKRKDAPKAAPIAKEEGPRIPAPRRTGLRHSRGTPRGTQ